MEPQDQIKAESNFRDPTAAIWPIVRLIVIALIAYVALSTLYSHGFDFRKDGSTIGLVVAAAGGVDVIKRFIATGEVVASKPTNPDA